jgi:hypothetical protein
VSTPAADKSARRERIRSRSKDPSSFDLSAGLRTGGGLDLRLDFTGTSRVSAAVSSFDEGGAEGADTAVSNESITADTALAATSNRLRQYSSPFPASIVV